MLLSLLGEDLGIQGCCISASGATSATLQYDLLEGCVCLWPSQCRHLCLGSDLCHISGVVSQEAVSFPSLPCI